MGHATCAVIFFISMGKKRPFLVLDKAECMVRRAELLIVTSIGDISNLGKWLVRWIRKLT